MLTEALEARTPGEPLDVLAATTVATFLKAGRIVPGLGHAIHKPVDPRTVRLFALAEENGLAGDRVHLMQLIGSEAERAAGKVLPVNVTGAIGAICCELGLDWRIVRGIAVIARTIGLVAAHLRGARDAARLGAVAQDRRGGDAGGPGGRSAGELAAVDRRASSPVT